MSVLVGSLSTKMESADTVSSWLFICFYVLGTYSSNVNVIGNQSEFPLVLLSRGRLYNNPSQ